MPIVTLDKLGIDLDLGDTIKIDTEGTIVRIETGLVRGAPAQVVYTVPGQSGEFRIAPDETERIREGT